jgi:hypothetical protein
MRSRQGLFAATAFLLALPLAALSQGLFGVEAEIVIHFMCAAGFTLLAWAIFDFATPRWMTWTGCLCASALAVIFLLQGISNLLPIDALRFLAFAVLGQVPERVLPDLLLVWFAGLLLVDSRGRTRSLGWLIMGIVVGVEVIGYGASLSGGSLYAAAPALKLVLLLPFVWLALESTKAATQGLGRTALPRPAAAVA